MSQIPTTDNEDNRSIAPSDFDYVQCDQPDEVADQQAQQLHQQPEPQFGQQQNLLDWTMNTGNTRNYDNELKEHKLMIANLESKNQTLQKSLENLELKAEIRALKENAEQKANYQALEAKLQDQFTKMLSTQTEEHQKHMAQLEAKNRKLEEKLSSVEMQTKETAGNEALDEKIKQREDQFANMFAAQQKQMMAQFDLLEQKLKMDKNELEEIIHANQQKMETLPKEMDENGKQAIGSNQIKLDNVWSLLPLTKSKVLAIPKGNVWNGQKSEISISECGLKATNSKYGKYVFATEGYPISEEQCRKENFQFPAGTIVFYYEVTGCIGTVGLADGNAGCGYSTTNSYAIAHHNNRYWLSGMPHQLEDPIRAIEGDVVGCGLLNSKNELAVFFTVNGILRVKPTLIYPTVDCLYPTVYVCAENSVEANFGNNIVAKPFKFDIDKCPGLVFE